MTVPPIAPLNMSDLKLLGNLARTNLYQVTLMGVGEPLSNSQGETFSSHISNPDLPYKIPLSQFISSGQLSFLCSEANLPASSYATAEVKDNFMGVPQEFAHTRINTDVDFTFYIDRNYKVLMFFEAWMDYISGGNNPDLTPPEPALNNPNLIQSGSYYRRMKYPKQYKTSQFYIKKFEKDYSAPGATNISYQLVNAFPKSMASIPVAYGEAEIMKVTITMNYDRYIPRREFAYSPPPTTTLDVNNADGTTTQATLVVPNSETGATGTLAQLANQGFFGPQTPQQ
jgi:hypothetical protein